MGRRHEGTMLRLIGEWSESSGRRAEICPHERSVRRGGSITKEDATDGEVSGFIRRGDDQCCKVTPQHVWFISNERDDGNLCWNTFIAHYGCQYFHIFCLPYPIICYDGDREDIFKILKSHPLELNVRKAKCILKDPSRYNALDFDL